MNFTAKEKPMIKNVMIVRDQDGNPKFDDPYNVPKEVLACLNQKDLEYLETLKEDKD